MKTTNNLNNAWNNDWRVEQMDNRIKKREWAYFALIKHFESKLFSRDTMVVDRTS